MRKFATIIVLVLMSQALFGQKIHDWEGGNPPAHEETPDIYEKVTRQLPADADADDVREALLQMKPVLTANGCDLVLKTAQQSLAGNHYTFRQTLQGYPVYQATVKVNLNKSNRMFSLLSNLRPISQPQQNFAATDQELEDHLYLLHYRDQKDFSFEFERVWFPTETGLLPAFRVELAADAGLNELILLDDAGALFPELAHRDLASYCRPMAPPPIDTTGTGMIFNPDPLTTSGNVYGNNYVDNDDNDSPFLNDERIQVVLRDINWNGTYFLLEGPYVKISDAESPSVPPVFSSDGIFNYTRSQSGFEDVMCYYHIDNYQRYIQSLGFLNLMNAQLIADPHGLFGQDNSHFVPQGGNIRVAFGEGGVDDAEDADVIVHEYGHALSYSASPGTNGGTERQGLDEGIGDYIAASYSKDLSYNLWKNTFTWDGHNEYWGGRSASINLTYPPNSADIYTYGQIWASTLMEVHDIVGRSASDKVFFQSLYGNLNNMSLTDAAHVILDADSMVFGGSHTLAYQDAFCRRGIFAGTSPGQACFVSAPDPILPEGAWKLFPNPANASVTIQLTDMARRKDLKFRIVNLLGQVVQIGEIKQEYTETTLRGMESGLYLMELWQGSSRIGSKRLEILH